MATSLTIGANYISEVALVDSDGNSVNRSAIDSLAVQIRQYGRLIETLTWPTARLTDGTAANKLKIEISPAVSASLKEGIVLARVVSGDTNALYTVGGARISLPDYHILTMYFELPDDNDDEVTVIEHYRGFYDASVNAAPSSGGAGTGGAILAGDYWVSNVAGTVFQIYCPVGTRFTALVNSPGQTSGNWQLSGSLG